MHFQTCAGKAHSHASLGSQSHRAALGRNSRDGNIWHASGSTRPTYPAQATLLGSSITFAGAVVAVLVGWAKRAAGNRRLELIFKEVFEAEERRSTVVKEGGFPRPLVWSVNARQNFDC